VILQKAFGVIHAKMYIGLKDLQTASAVTEDLSKNR
jgi:hypothetical protein